MEPGAGGGAGADEGRAAAVPHAAGGTQLW